MFSNNTNEYNILEDNGKIKREIADKLALDEYKKYRIVQDEKYISDFLLNHFRRDMCVAKIL